MYKKILTINLILAITATVFAYKPVGSIKELYQLDRLPLLRQGVKCKMFSSYDRSGGNDDGFDGTYSKLRVENGNSVIAGMSGAGCIQRIWFTHSKHKKNGLLDLKGEHIKIYIDGSEKPALDIPLEKLFSGELKRFPKPLVGTGLGGFYCYVPIPYREGCKVVVEGTDVRFYQITYNEFADCEGVESFSMNFTPETSNLLNQAVKLWSLPDKNIFLNSGKQAKKIEKVLALKKNETINFQLPKGNYMIKSIRMEVDKKDKKNALDGIIKINWENAETPAVNLPISYLFGQAFSPKPYCSILFGTSGKYFYNNIPMPYQQSASIHISAKESFNATLRIVVEPTNFKKCDFGYLHADYSEMLPTVNGKYYTLLKTRSKGHYLGTFLVTEGKKGLPTWLEGDEIFIVDEEQMIHGTGSEDYFNCGWYGVDGRLNQPGDFPLHGFPVFGDKNNKTRAAAYRWHISDVIPYQKSIDAKIEHGMKNNCPTDYRSAVFYYDINPY